MVTDCLSGVQETLNTCVPSALLALPHAVADPLPRSYAVRHDQFDFESELGWEGSNDKVRSGCNTRALTVSSV